MKTLLEYMDEAFFEIKHGLPFKSVRDFISDDDSCADFIRVILHDEEFSVPEKKSSLYEFSKARARHAVIMFLIGIAFSRFDGLEDDVMQKMMLEDDADSTEAANRHKVFLRLWMLTSLYHDYGYYSSYLEQEDVVFSKLARYYYLFDENYSDNRMKPVCGFSEKYPAAMAFSYGEILAYDKYSRKYLKSVYTKNPQKNRERIDHGILGGVLIFERLIKALLKENASVQAKEAKEMIAAKASCITIAQHNIYWSSSSEQDIQYGKELQKLHHNSAFRITRDTPLLLLLCLVDTFECIKRFGKGEVGKGALNTVTVLSKIEIDLTDSFLILDYSKLENHIEKSTQKSERNKLKNLYTDYIGVLCRLESWTQWSAVLEGSIVKISMSNRQEEYIAAAKNITGGTQYV